MTASVLTARSQPILLDDYISADDFPANLTALTGGFGARLGLPVRADELGLLCPDVRKAADYLTERHGAGPFFLGEGSPTKFVERGQLTPFTTRVGFGYHRGVLIELAEPGLGSTLFTPAQPSEQILVHHLGFFARGDNLRRPDRHGRDAYFLDRMHGAGYPLHVSAVLAVAGLLGRIHIFDTAAETGGLELEFLDFRLLWAGGPAIRLYPWMLGLAARLQIRTGHRTLKMRSHHQLPPPQLPPPQLPPPFGGG
jgi:hypothetical protein